MLQTLKDHQIYAKFPKCEFWLKSMTSLGHVVSNEGIMVNLTKTDAISWLARPTYVTKVRSFVSLVG